MWQLKTEEEDLQIPVYLHQNIVHFPYSRNLLLLYISAVAARHAMSP
jgi:hypothetical protein